MWTSFRFLRVKRSSKKYFQFNWLPLGQFSAASIIAGKIWRDFSMLKQANKQMTVLEDSRRDVQPIIWRVRRVNKLLCDFVHILLGHIPNGWLTCISTTETSEAVRRKHTHFVLQCSACVCVVRVFIFAPLFSYSFCSPLRSPGPVLGPKTHF